MVPVKGKKTKLMEDERTKEEFGGRNAPSQNNQLQLCQKNKPKATRNSDEAKQRQKLAR